MQNNEIELDEPIALDTMDNLTLVVGKRGCGKSYDTFDFLLKQDRLLILDVNREYDKNCFGHPYFKNPYYLYNTVDEISIDKINDCKRIKRIIPFKDGKNMSLNETFELSKNILKKYNINT